MINAAFSNGVLTFENNCPATSPAATRVGDVVTIRTPGTAAGCYSDFLVIAGHPLPGDPSVGEYLAVEIGSERFAAWEAGRWSPPCV
jgi:hypothetical protein